MNIFKFDGIPSHIAVADTGMGIKPEFLDGLFDYSQNISSKGTAGKQGTGFGLPLTHEIISAHGGELYADSEPGKKTTFFIQLANIRVDSV